MIRRWNQKNMKEWHIICAFHQAFLGSQNHDKQHGAGEWQMCVKGEEGKQISKKLGIDREGQRYL